MLLFVQTPAFEIPNVDEGETCSTHRAEYCDNVLQKFQPLMQFGSQNSFCHFSQSLPHIWHLLHLLTLLGNHYADHCQHFCVYHASVYAYHTPEIFSMLCHHTHAAIWWVSPLVISTAKHKVWYSYTVQLYFQLWHNLTHANKTNNCVMPLEVMKW